MANGKYEFKQVQFRLADDYTECFVYIEADANCPHMIGGWHHKKFASRISCTEILEKWKSGKDEDNPIFWPATAPERTDDEPVPHVGQVDALPLELTPVNVLAFLYRNFGACGCTEMEELLREIRRILEWHDREADPKTGEKDRIAYGGLYPNVGTFYLVAGILDHMGFAEHGTAIRHPWLTPEGTRFHDALKKFTDEEIVEAKGEAYDGCEYGHQ